MKDKIMYRAKNSFAVIDGGEITGQILKGDKWEYVKEEMIVKDIFPTVKLDCIVVKNYYDIELVLEREHFVKVFERIYE